MEDFLERQYFGNTVHDYIITLAIIIVGFLIVGLFKRYVLKRLKHWASQTETNLDDLFVKGLERFALPMLSFLIIYWGLHYLRLSERVAGVVQIALAAIFTYFILRIISNTIQLVLQTYMRTQEGGEEKVKQLRGIMIIVNVMIWGLGLLALAQNLGYDITAIIAGLGIGGIAVALAAQNILGDLFNYFVIFFDRPFEIGDFIVVDDKRGTVEHIGIKTTRFKSLTGEQLVMSNSDLTKSRLHNFKRMQRRRILFTIGVTYSTPSEKLREIPALIRHAIESHNNTTFDRAHFAAYGESSLNFEVVYFVESSEYIHYMDVQQSVNLFLFEEFEKRGIEFAFPSRTLYFATNNEKDNVLTGSPVS